MIAIFNKDGHAITPATRGSVADLMAEILATKHGLLDRADLKGMNFSGLNLRGFTFNDCNLNEANFLQTDFINCTFLYCSARSALFESALFRDCKIKGSDFQNAIFEKAQLRDTSLFDNDFSKSRDFVIQMQIGSLSITAVNDFLSIDDLHIKHSCMLLHWREHITTLGLDRTAERQLRSTLISIARLYDEWLFAQGTRPSSSPSDGIGIVAHQPVSTTEA